MKERIKCLIIGIVLLIIFDGSAQIIGRIYPSGRDFCFFIAGYICAITYCIIVFYRTIKSIKNLNAHKNETD